MVASNRLTPISECLARMQQHAAQCAAMPHEQVALHSAFGRILAVPIQSAIAVPPLDNSAMDGYACRVADVQPDRDYRVSGICYAGQAPQTLAQGQILRIFTGAPLPLGADAVIMQENVQAIAPDQIRIQQLPKSGENIRRAGQDIQQGQIVLPVGTRLGAAEIGLLASIGVATLCVYPRLRVSVIATGDELVEVGQPLAIGQIYNSNAPFLVSLLQQLGCEVVQSVQVADQPELLRGLLLDAATNSDLILTSGGASVGDADHLKPVLQQIGAIEQWKVAIKPGKPMVWGQVNPVHVSQAHDVQAHDGQAKGSVPLIGLPGNPQSVWVTFLILALPYIKRLQGQTEGLQPIGVAVAAGFSRSKPQGRTEYLRVRLDQGQLIAHPNQSSGVLSSAVWADGFAVIETGQTVELGQPVLFLPFSGLLG